MKIKAEICGSAMKEPPSYPCIKISKEGRIVLFTAPKSGTLLSGANYKPGEVSGSWCEEDFSLFEGRITLSNEYA